MTSLSNKVAFVTGGSRGIGAAIVRRLARDGAAVAFTYQSSGAGAQQLVESIQAAGGRAHAYQADAADAAAVTRAINEAANHFGRIDILGKAKADASSTSAAQTRTACRSPAAPRMR